MVDLEDPSALHTRLLPAGNFSMSNTSPPSALDLLDNPLNETDSKWSTMPNLTRLFVAAAAEMVPNMANYTMNMLDVGLALATEASTPSTEAGPSAASAETAFAIMTNSRLNSSALGHTNSLAEQVPEHVMDHAPQLSSSGLLKVYVLTVMALFSLLGNLLTIWNIYKTRITRRNSRHTWSAIYSLMFHLSIADVLVTGFCLIGEAAWCYTVQWLANELTCKLVKLFQMFSLYLSTYVLVLIGVDRWIAVKYPMKSLNMAKRCHRLLGGTYILSLVLSLPQVSAGYANQFNVFLAAGGATLHSFFLLPAPPLTTIGKLCGNLSPAIKSSPSRRRSQPASAGQCLVHVRVEAGVICLLYGTHTHNTYTPPWQRVNTPWQASCRCDACAGIKSECFLHKSLLNAALDIATPTASP